MLQTDTGDHGKSTKKDPDCHHDIRGQARRAAPVCATLTGGSGKESPQSMRNLLLHVKVQGIRVDALFYFFHGNDFSRTTPVPAASCPDPPAGGSGVPGPGDRGRNRLRTCCVCYFQNFLS